jgi:hypothetical protein
MSPEVRLLFRATVPFALAVTAAGAQEPAPTEVPFSFQPKLPSGSELQSATFSSDGNICYVHVRVPAIEAWSTIVHYWREGAPALVGMVFLMCAALAVPSIRRRQRRGNPYCRKCNYDLSSIAIATEGSAKKFSAPPDARCPECGALIGERPPRSGRSLIRRLVPHAAIVIVACAAYGTLLLAKVPRDGRVSLWLDWSSSRLADLANARSITWLQARIKQSDQILAFDLKKGTFARTLATKRTCSFTNIQLSPDGKLLFLGSSGEAGALVIAVSTSSGRTMHELPARGRNPVFIHVPSIIGFSADGRTVYVACGEWKGTGCGVIAWNLDTGAESDLVKAQAYGGGPGSYAPSFAMWRPGPSFLSWPGFMEAYGTKTFKVHLYEPNRPTTSFDLKTMPESNATLVIAADGSKMFVAGQYGSKLLSVPLPNGAPIASLSIPGNIWPDLSMSPDSAFLLVPFMSFYKRGSQGRGSVLVREVASGRWVAELLVPAGLIAPKAVVSRDRHWVAAVCQANGPGAPRMGPGVHQLLIWDMATLLEDSAPPFPRK